MWSILNEIDIPISLCGYSVSHRLAAMVIYLPRLVRSGQDRKLAGYLRRSSHYFRMFIFFGKVLRGRRDLVAYPCEEGQDFK